MKHRKVTLATKASRAFGWNFGSNALSKLGGIGISIMLARLLGPHAFGVYAVALVALLAMQNFNELGMSMAIVRWEADPRDIIPTVATISVLVSVVTYVCCYLVAPAYVSAMGAPAAAAVVRVLALAIVVDGFCNTPSGLLQRQFHQGKAAIAAQTGNWIGTALTVALALSHYGAMSLAVGQVAGALVVSVLLVAFAPESLRFGFDPARARALLRFGLPLAGANLVVFAVASVDQIIVGHLLGPTLLALYVLALNLSSWPFNMVAPPVTNVAPAVFSRLQRDPPAMRSTFVSAARILIAVTLPICLLIGGCATPLTGFLYGARWLPAAQPLMWLALAGAARILLRLAYDYLVVLGRTRLLLTIQLVWLGALIASLMVATRADGIAGAALAVTGVTFLIVVPCYLAALQKAGIGLAALGKSLLLPVAAAAVAGLAAAAAAVLAPSDLIALAVSGVITTAIIGLICYRMRSTFARYRRNGTGGDESPGVTDDGGRTGQSPQLEAARGAVWWGRGVNIGETLTEARSAAGLTVAQVSRQVRVREAIITRVEDDDFSACGGDDYARGYIRIIARAVGADEQPLIEEYNTLRPGPQTTTDDLGEPVTPVRVGKRPG